MWNPRLSSSASRAIDYISHCNISNIFKTSEFDDPNCEILFQKFDLNFPAGFLLHALSFVPADLKTTELDHITQKLKRKLIQESKATYTYNFWHKNLENSKPLNLPDDIDDTACIYSALYKSGYQTPVETFIKTAHVEASAGGPYRTWYTSHDDPKWQDIDPIANAHFLYLSALNGIKLPNTQAYLISSLNQNQISSPYYPTDLMFYLYLTRYVQASHDEVIGELALSKLQDYSSKHLSSLDKLLLALCLSNLDQALSPKLISEILDLQQVDGSLPPLPVSFGFNIGRQDLRYVGSNVASTALFLELLMMLKSTDSPPPEQKSTQVGTFQRHIMQTVEKTLPRKLATYFDKDKAYKAVLVPISIALDLNEGELDQQQLTTLENLSLAMLFGWISYTLMDDLLDQQRDSDIVPTILSLSKHTWEYADKLPIGFVIELRQAFEVMDKYYGWEVRKGRFKADSLLPKRFDHNRITDRMHAYLTALKWIPKLIGIHPKLGNDLYKFMNHIAVIEQLNDDGHDWAEDMELGILNLVTWNLRKFKQLDSKRDYAEIFAHEVTPQLIAICSKSYQRAQKLLPKFERNDFLKVLLDSKIAPIRALEAELARTKSILASMESPA